MVDRDEWQRALFRLINEYRDYYAGHHLETNERIEETLDRFIFSLLAVFDGEGIGFPGCEIRPLIEQPDESFLPGEDITGDLHDKWCRFREQRDGLSR
jgi:hypothetical protein